MECDNEDVDNKGEKEKYEDDEEEKYEEDDEDNDDEANNKTQNVSCSHRHDNTNDETV